MNSESGKIYHLSGGFSDADDLLWLARSADLGGRGEVVVRKSGRIGPLVEIVQARHRLRAEYANVALRAPFAQALEDALHYGRISGTFYQDIAGVYPLSRCSQNDLDNLQWDLWRNRAEQAAARSLHSQHLAAGIIGAMGELQDNVFRHGSRPETGLVAYAATAGTFEVVVADAGIGVLRSLKENPEFSNLQDSGEALKCAVQDGNSRFGRSGGNGFGMGQMFRALANHDGELRFRSGDHALTVRGHSPSLRGRVELAHKAELDGACITVICRAP